jgi:hypothetical protein
VNDRLKLLFGSSYGLRFVDREGEGACAKFILPIISNEAEIKKIYESLVSDDGVENAHR